MGHEYLGVVEEVRSDVRTIRQGKMKTTGTAPSPTSS
jgi:threonine dehydrogenase-like Zn-dependent dehydrogenase